MIQMLLQILIAFTVVLFTHNCIFKLINGYVAFIIYCTIWTILWIIYDKYMKNK